MPSLGRNHTAPPFGVDVIKATYTEECDTIDVSNRTNASDGYKCSKAGMVSKVWEIECHDGAAAALTSLLEEGGSGFTVVGVTETASVDGVKTITITAKES